MARAKAKSVKRRAPAKTSPHKLRARVHGSTLELLDPMPILLRDGEEVTITLSKRTWKPDLDALRRAAGSWKGIVDTDALLKDIYASRSIKSRRPVPRL
jgi:hypothetical protein